MNFYSFQDYQYVDRNPLHIIRDSFLFDLNIVD